MGWEGRQERCFHARRVALLKYVDIIIISSKLIMLYKGGCFLY